MNDGRLIGDIVCEGTVQPEWIDVNDHMNVAYYVLAFDMGVDQLWNKFGITDDYIRNERGSTFAVEAHISYLGELVLDDPFVVTSQLLSYDEKRIHQFMRLYNQKSKVLAATAEWMNLHVNLDSRRVSPWPEKILERISRHASQQTDLDWPELAGRKMLVRQPLFTLGEVG